MRIAICFSGQLRTAVHAAPQILKWIGPLIDQCDFFIHTWDSNTYKGGQPHLGECVKLLANINLGNYDRMRNIDIPVTSAEINSIRQFYNPKSFIIDDFITVRDHWSNYWYSNYREQFNFKEPFNNYWNPLYYSFYRSIELKQAHERQHNFKYDMVIKLRPDVSYPLKTEDNPFQGHAIFRESSLINEVKNHFDLSKFYWNVTTDFWYGSSHIMDIAASHWINNFSHSELNMGQHCKNNNIQLHRANINSLAFHRIVATNCPGDDFMLIYMIEKLFNDYDMLDLVKTKLTDEWRLKLGKALIDYNVIDIFCKLHGCGYTVGS